MTLYDKIMNKKDKRVNWTETQVLISELVRSLQARLVLIPLLHSVDEISMIDPGLFTKLNLLGKLIRQNARPFGRSTPSPTPPTTHGGSCPNQAASRSLSLAISSSSLPYPRNTPSALAAASRAPSLQRRH